MKMVRFETPDCAEFRLHLDTYVSGELLIDTSLAMLHHAATCALCAGLYRARLQLRAALRHAVVSDAHPPPSLEARVRQQLRRPDSSY